MFATDWHVFSESLVRRGQLILNVLCFELLVKNILETVVQVPQGWSSAVAFTPTQSA